jgi:potassium efflux system protein
LYPHDFRKSPIFVAGALRKFAMLFVPLMFVATLNGLDHSPPPNRDSLGRIAFNLAMVALAAFLAHLLRRRNPLIHNLVTQAPKSMAARLHGFWMSLLVAMPLAWAALAIAGYLTAAGYFFGRTLQSLFLVLSAVMLYGLIALWVRLQHYHLRRRQEQAARPAESSAGRAAGSEVAELRQSHFEVTALSEQTRSLLDLLITLLLLGGLWWVWEDALPVLSVISDYALWTYASEEGVKNSVTVGGLTLATLIGVVTSVAVRNVGALLDIVLLQRLDMQADATYAIKVLAPMALP